MAISGPLEYIEHPSGHVVQNLTTAVEGALWSFEPLRTTKSRLGVTVDDAGRVTLRGNVRTDILKSVAGRLAAGVPGVGVVVNELVSDAAVESAAAVLLAATHPALVTGDLELRSRIGVLYLGGIVRTTDKAAVEAALSQAVAGLATLDGVHDVISAYSVVERGAVASAEATTAAAGGSGAEEAAMQERLRIWRERVATQPS